MKKDLTQERLELLFSATDIRPGRGHRKAYHARSCECLLCMQNKLEGYQERAKMAVRGGARPENQNQTIPVRAHWRVGRNHLKNDPELRKIIREIVKELLMKQK
jgi:hypothetical protein